MLLDISVSSMHISNLNDSDSNANTDDLPVRNHFHWIDEV